MTRVKICGIRTPAAAAAAAEAGASAIGLIFAAESRRRVTPEQAAAIVRELPPFVSRVAVVVNETLDGLSALIGAVGVDTVQLHGDETPSFCAQVRGLGVKVIKALPVGAPLDLAAVRAYPVAAVLLDTARAGQRGGTGHTFNWDHARPVAAAVPTVLSGGLSPANVADGIGAVRPYGVDSSSGVETDGEKDPQKIRAFLAAVREADARLRDPSGSRS